MDLGLVTIPYALNGEFRRQDRHSQVAGASTLLEITFWRPQQERVAKYQIAVGVDRNKATTRQRIKSCLVSDLGVPASDSRALKFPIYVIGKSGMRRTRILRAEPSLPEVGESFAATFGARPVTSGQRHRFVEKEEFGVAVRRHYDAPPLFEFEETGNPAPIRIATNNFVVLVVQYSTPIAHKRAARIVCNNFAERRHTIL